MSSIASQAGQILSVDTQISNALDTLETTLTTELTDLTNQLAAQNNAAGSAVDLTPQINASSALLTKVQNIIAGIPTPAAANTASGATSTGTTTAVSNTATGSTST